MIINKENSGAHVIFYRMLKTRPEINRDSGARHAVLLCKRTQDAPDHAGHWGLIGGALKDEESPKEGLLREVREELKACGLEKALRSLKKLCSVTIKKSQAQVTIHYFTAPLNTEMNQLRLKKNRKSLKVEGEGLAWFTAAEIHHLRMRPEDRRALNEFFNDVYSLTKGKK